MDALLFVLLLLGCCIVMAVAGAFAGVFVGYHIAKWRGVPTMEGRLGMAAVFGGGPPGILVGMISGYFVARWIWGG